MDKETDPIKQIDEMVRELLRETGSLKIKLREVSDDHYKFTKGIFLEIIELADSFENLLEKKNKITDSNVKSLYKLLKRMIKGFDLVPVKADPGDVVDTDIHHVIETEFKEYSDKSIIIRTLNPGYFWKGHLLRPAEVRASVKEKKN